VAHWSGRRAASDAALARAARITKADKARMRDAATMDAGPRLQAMLDAEFLSPDTTSTGRKHRKTLG
jgi:hypothetical protein